MQRKPLITAYLSAVLVSVLLTRSHTAASSPLLPQPDLTAPEVMENVRKAVHFSEYGKLSRGIYLQGTASAWGEKGTYTLLASGSGPFVLTNTFPTISKSPQIGAFDGQMHWSADWTGANSVNDPGTGGERQLFIEAQTQGWLDPARKLMVTLGKSKDKDVSLELESADGYSAATVTVDRTTWLPKSITVQGAVVPRVVTLGDYRTELGLVLPHTIKATRASVTDTFTLERAEEAPTFIRNPYEMLPWKPTDTTFDASKPAALETRSGPSGHILVHPLVNGKDVGWFILDTGAGWMVMDRKVADELTLPSVGSIPTAGVGGIVTGHLRPTAEFALGQATVKGLLLNDLDLSSLGLSFGTRIAGIVGYDVLRRVVMEIDLAGKKASLYDPARYTLNGASWEPLGFVNRSPYVMAEFDKGLKGPFRLDTGAMASVIFHAPTVRKYHLLEGREVSTEQIGGVGGNTNVKVGTIKSFTLGGKKFEKPSAIFTQADTGVMADRFLAGTIGHPFMRPFMLVFDYSNNRMAFLPHGTALR